MVLINFRCLQNVDNKKVTLKQVRLNTDPGSSHENNSKLLCVGFMIF